MDRILNYDYCAVFILVILLLSTVFRKMTQGKLNRLFLLMVLLVLVTACADICAVNFDQMGSGNVVGKYISHTLYLFLHNAMPPVYIAYLVTQSDTWHKLQKRPLLRALLGLPISIVGMLLAINFFWHIVFYLDENDHYTRGPWFFSLYIAAMIYVVYGLCYLFYYRKLFSLKRFSALVVIFPLMIVAVVVQLLNPHLLVEMFLNACGLLYISMMIQRPEERMDDVTGLAKISAYVEDMRRCFRNKKPVHIIMLNIVNFQSVRDMLGYDHMNEVLREIGIGLTGYDERTRTSAEIYYLGVGKFRFVLDEWHFYKTEEIASRINEIARSQLSINNMNVNLITNLCVAKCPEDIDNVDALLAFDRDLNNLPNTGKVLKASEYYKKERYDIMKDIDAIIDRAITEHRFSVYYQPIFSVQKQRFLSAEALLRLKDEKYGFISPELFIPAAEKSGAIHRIGAFVFEEVCRFISSDEFKDLGLEYIEVNLSVVQCMQEDLAQQLVGLLKKYHIRPDQINLEITETAASYSQKTLLENLKALNYAGIGLSLDDFGTGYSNMRRIASLPFHLVKLDKSFTDLEGNPKLLIVLQNTIKMIKAMNMQIVVEGIETEQLVRQFSDLQCEYIQGYYYSKPIPKDEFVKFITEANA